jgi:CheY-like chemotaxis protein
MTTKVKSVLIVDDEKMLRETVAFYVEQKVEKVYFASSGNEAIDFLKNNSVDLVITDIRMPDGDGIDLMKAIQSLSGDKPKVIAMTGFAGNSEDVLNELQVKIVLSKPFSGKDLFSAIELVFKPE